MPLIDINKFWGKYYARRLKLITNRNIKHNTETKYIKIITFPKIFKISKKTFQGGTILIKYQ